MKDIAYQQLLQIIECRRCKGAKGRTWRKDGALVTAEPCEKHQRMLDTQGWVRE